LLGDISLATLHAPPVENNMVGKHGFLATFFGTAWSASHGAASTNIYAPVDASLRMGLTNIASAGQLTDRPQWFETSRATSGNMLPDCHNLLYSPVLETTLFILGPSLIIVIYILIGGLPMSRFYVALFAAVSTIAMTQSASAADLSTKAPAYIAPVAAYHWTGFYAGGHAGAGWGSDGSQSMADPAAGVVLGGFDPVTFGSSAKVGAVGGFQFGYNWQVAPTWLLGVEGDFSFTSLKNSNSKAPLTAGVGSVVIGSSLSMSANVEWLSSIRGRVGYIWDNNLLYLTGGAAWKNTDFSSRLVALAPFVSQTNFNQTQGGWVLGGGIDHMLTANWILGAEYLFYQFGTERAGAPFTPTGLPIAYTWKDNVQAVRARLSYKF
jgi:outer membrane immunogenic protein